MKFIVLLIFLFALTGGIYAQEIDTTLLIEDVVITQNRLSSPLSETARNISVLRKQDIEKMPVLNVPELLQYAGGVDIRRRGVNGVQSDAGIRGGTFNQVLILINGVKMADPQTGHHMMNLPVALEDIERVEIIKGPAARVYGQNAFSGVINIITDINAEERPSVSASAGISSFETYSGNVHVKVPTKYYDQSISFSRISSEGYRYNTDYDINTLYYQGEIKNAKNGINIHAGYTGRKFGANGFYASEEFVDQYEEVTTAFAAATTLITSGNLTLRPRVSWRHNVDEYVFLRQDPSVFMNTHKSHSYNGELHAAYHSEYGETGVGIDLSRQTLKSNNLGDRERTILGLFAEHKFSMWEDKLTITPGLYANKFSDYSLRVFPGVDVSYAISNNLGLYATSNWSNRIPTYTNLYYTSRAEQGNENLKSESATAVELGAKYNSKNVSLTLSGWHRANRNLIDWVKTDTAQEKWFAENFAAVNMLGFDVNSRYKFQNMLGADRHVDLTVDYTYINAEIKDQDVPTISRYSLDNLRHQFIVGAQFTILPESLYLGSHFRYLDRVSLEDYTQLDLNLRYRYGSFDALFGIQNVGDVIYRETNLVPMPGRWFSFSIRYRS